MIVAAAVTVEVGAVEDVTDEAGNVVLDTGCWEETGPRFGEPPGLSWGPDE